jgi:aspartate aminotransferase-like enzyme
MTMRVPDCVVVEHLYARLKERGFIIYRCKGALAEHYVQIANMGELSDATIDAFLGALSEEVAAARTAASPQGRERLRGR